jgi:hypothetical protein
MNSDDLAEIERNCRKLEISFSYNSKMPDIDLYGEGAKVIHAIQVFSALLGRTFVVNSVYASVKELTTS